MWELMAEFIQGSTKLSWEFQEGMIVGLRELGGGVTKLSRKSRKTYEAYTAMWDSMSAKERVANKEKYKMANKEAKKGVTLAKNKAYEKLCQRLETKDRERCFYASQSQGKKNKGPWRIRCIKGENGKVLVEEAKIKEGWQSYLHKLVSGKENGSFENHELE